VRLLILGGTRFLGRALGQAALERGHKLSLFNRGQSNPDLFPQAEHLRGSRGTDISTLNSGEWDAVIDTCGYFPRVVRESAGLLAGRIDRYIFISSLSVYANFSKAGTGENGPLASMPDPTIEEITEETYGPLKALCEQAAETALPGRTLVVRPGLIVGPHDPTDRFTYWPYRAARGGEVLAPGRPQRAVQYIDVRDLADWLIQMVETRKTGIYNANGPAGQCTMGELLETCRSSSGADARFTWVSEQFLLEKQVGPWIELPLWIPESDPMMAGFFSFASGKAIREGLTFRPVEATVRDTLQWTRTWPDDHTWQAGLTAEKENELLSAWRSR